MKLVAPALSAEHVDAAAAARPDRGKPLVVGLLDNVKPNGDVAVERMLERLADSGVSLTAVRHTKGHAGRGVEPEGFEALSRCDLVLNALACCGSCTSWTVHDTVMLEQAGVPTVTCVTEPFLPLAGRVAQSLDLSVSKLRLAVVPHALALEDADSARTMIDALGEQLQELVYGARDGDGAASAPAANVAAASANPYELARIELPDDQEAATDHYREAGWLDGLPIVLPTEERVERMLGDRAGERTALLGKVPPRDIPLTLESLAVNAVMAGCRPADFPVVVAAAAAVLDPSFNLLGVNTTTNAATPMLVVNGPIAAELGINGGGDVFGSFHRANISIGRTIRLMMISVGDCRPQDGDMATNGQAAKVGLCIAENVEDSPWEPLHEELGCPPEDSAVTALSVTAQYNLLDFASRNADDLLKMLGNTIATPGIQNVQTGGGPVVVLGPEHANRLANAGFAKADVKRWLFEQARVPLPDFSQDTIEDVLRPRRPRWALSVTDRSSMVPIADSPEDVTIVVAGGVGPHSVLLPTFLGSRPVRAMRLGDEPLTSPAAG